MGQEEVIEYLKKERKPLSRKEIADGLKENVNKISHILNSLLKWEEIKCIEIDRLEAKEKYGCFHRMNLYYV